jgi:8-oxo-dGTP diphosphatase
MREARGSFTQGPPSGEKKGATPAGALPTIQVAAGIIWRGPRFLAAKRPEGKPRAGFWEFPGGKQEAGESMLEALVRELREELDITCEAVLPWRTLVHDYPDQRVVLHFLHVTAFSGIPVCKDGQELRWITPEESRMLPFLPADKRLVADLAPPPAGAGSL